MKLIPKLRTLDRYILGRFASIYLGCLFSFTLLFVLIDAITHIEDLAKRTEGASELLFVCLSYYSAITPLIFCQVLGPVVAVSAALFTVTTFQRSNELIPILASGQSYQRTLLPIISASMFLSAAVFFVQELWIPRTVAAVREASARRDGSSRTKHFNFLDTTRQNLIVIKEYERYSRRATGIDVLPIARGGGAQRVIRAESAVWIENEPGSNSRGYWLLEKGTIQEYDPEGRRLVLQPPPSGAPPATLARLDQPFEQLRLETDLLPADVELRKGETVYMTLSDLRRKAMSSLGQSAWYMKYFSRFAYPLTNFVLVLLGLPVIVSFGNRNIFFGAILAVIISTSYFVANSVFQDLGIGGSLPVRVGAGLAPLLFTSLGLTLYRGMKT